MAGAPAAPGAVLVRSADPERQLQGLRTALSLAMGDRPASLYIAEGGARVLSAPAGSEAAQCLASLPEAGVAVLLAEDAVPGAAQVKVRAISRQRMLEELAAAEFQQTF